MSIQVVEVLPNRSSWLVRQDGQIAANTSDRASALGHAAWTLRGVLGDPAALAGIELRGFTLAEVLPNPPIRPPNLPLPSVIDFAEAKRRVAERRLPRNAERVCTPLAVADKLCVEYEWGWVIHWRPVKPTAATFRPEYPFPYLADRVTGSTGTSGGTLGLWRGVINLLQDRPPELSWPYPPGRQHQLVVRDAFAAAGAFTPIAKPVRLIGPPADSGT